MKEIVSYILQTVACSALFVLFYRVVLQGRTSFRIARVYLPASLLAAAVIPALDIPVWRVAPIEIPLVPAVETATAAVTSAPPTVPAVDRAAIALWILWGAGLVSLALVMVRQIVRIASIRRRAELHRADGFRVAVSGEVCSPFSFLGTVFIGCETPSDEIRQIVMHEASHIRHRHSVEKLAMEVIKNLQWFNPFAWWATRLLAEVHEFEADRDVLDGGFTVEEYLPLIFRQTFGYIPELSAGLGDSLTKKRFLMMKNKMKLTKSSWLRVAGVLPLAAGAMLLFSFTSRPPEIIFTELPALSVETSVQNPVEVPDMVTHKADVISVAFRTAASEPEPVTANTTKVRSEIIEVVRESPQSPQSPQVIEVTPIYNPEVMPLFQGGDLNSFRNWVQERVVYPREAVEKNISGTVTVRYVVERDGSVSSIEEVASPSKLLTDETIRVIGLSPKWTPGTQRGRPVRVFYILPIQFRLTEHNPAPVAPSASVPAAPSTTGEVAMVAQADADGGVRGMVIRRTGVDPGKEPLIILDGEEITDMSSVDVNTVKAISVLKEASATALYGERGRNGVILITTKEADGKVTITMKSDDNGVRTAQIRAEPGTEMGVINELKQRLREANVTSVSYTTADGQTVTEKIE